MSLDILDQIPDQGSDILEGNDEPMEPSDRVIPLPRDRTVRIDDLMVPGTCLHLPRQKIQLRSLSGGFDAYTGAKSIILAQMEIFHINIASKTEMEGQMPTLSHDYEHGIKMKDGRSPDTVSFSASNVNGREVLFTVTTAESEGIDDERVGMVLRVTEVDRRK